MYHHYVNGERRVTVLLTRWESMRDAEQLDLALPDSARLYTCRYGVNLVVVAGDFADKAEALTRTTMTQMNYWPDEPRR